VECLREPVREVPHATQDSEFNYLLLAEEARHSLEPLFVTARAQLGNGVSPCNRSLRSFIKDVSRLVIVGLNHPDLFGGKSRLRTKVNVMQQAIL